MLLDLDALLVRHAFPEKARPLQECCCPEAWLAELSLFVYYSLNSRAAFILHELELPPLLSRALDRRRFDQSRENHWSRKHPRPHQIACQVAGFKRSYSKFQLSSHCTFSCLIDCGDSDLPFLCSVSAHLLAHDTCFHP